MYANKKACASVGAPAQAETETLTGSQSDYILAQKIWNSLIEIWGQENGLSLEVRTKEKLAV